MSLGIRCDRDGTELIGATAVCTGHGGSKRGWESGRGRRTTMHGGPGRVGSGRDGGTVVGGRTAEVPAPSSGTERPGYDHDFS
jgi:hypothetical protein